MNYWLAEFLVLIDARGTVLQDCKSKMLIQISDKRSCFSHVGGKWTGLIYFLVSKRSEGEEKADSLTHQ